MTWIWVFIGLGIMMIFQLITGILLYILIINLLKDPENGKLIIGKNSWHCKIAYPFKRFYGSRFWPLSRNLITYVLKIVFMLYFTWPIIITWEVLKLTLYTPFLILFRAYPQPSLKAMHDESPFVVNVKYFYVPTTAQDIPILPLYPVLAALYSWLIYRFTFWTILITILILLIFFSIFIAYPAIRDYIESRPNKNPDRTSRFRTLKNNISQKISRYNRTIEIDNS